MKKLICGVLCLSPLIACESVSSVDVTTNGMYANFEVSADGSGTSRANAVLRVGGPSSNVYVDMAEGDSLSAAMNGGDSVEMEKASLGDFKEYNAEFDLDVEDTEFVFDFLRDAGESAEGNAVSLPAQFAFTGPEEDATFSRADDALVVTWDGGSDDSIRYMVDGDCISLHSEIADVDEGSITIDAGTLEATDENDPETCTVDITVRRVRGGTVVEAFGEGGLAEGVQVRTMSVVSAP